MKRPRAAPSVFGGDSDSDDSSRKRPPRLPPFKFGLESEQDSDLRGKAHGSSSNSKQKSYEEDSLDQYMNSLKAAHSQPDRNRQLPAQQTNSSESSSEHIAVKGIRAGSTDARVTDGSETATGEEGKGERLARDLVLEPVDHARKVYPEIMSCEYVPLPRLEKLTLQERMSKLRDMGGSVVDGDDIVPIETFQDLALVLPKPLLGSVLAAFEKPTPIQKVAIPAALQGRNIIGVAKTGSGKTAAYSIPLLCHISVQVRGSSKSGKGPSALIIAPTRELALQISVVVRDLGEGMNTGVLCVVGGHAKYEQFKRLRDSGAEVVVCTPGRFIDMIKMKACSLARCSFIVLDEADRMFDMGFGYQVDALLSQIRPDAQKLLFSATFPRNVAKLAKTYVHQPLRITIGQHSGDDIEHSAEKGESAGLRPRNLSARSVPMVTENVTEIYVALDSEAEKESWLVSRLEELIRQGLVIVFCQTRGGAAILANVIRTSGKPAACVHGETDHADREGLLRMFRSGELPLLVTTDLSARGLDIANVKNVVNYGCAKSWEWHVHRVGRTGRAAEKGMAYTLISKSTKADMCFVPEAISAYRRSELAVPQVLLELEVAERNPRGALMSRGKGFRGRRRHK